MIFSRVAAFPFLIWLSVIVYQVFFLKDESAIYQILPIILCLTVLYIFQHQINMWYWKKNPPKLDTQIFHMIEKSLPIVKSLSIEKMTIFHDRLSIYLKQVEFIGQGLGDIPDDIKASILAPAVLYSLNQKETPYEHYQRIALYKHPFLSPDYNETIHVSEINHEDGMLILSLEQMMPALLDTNEGIHLSLYEFAKVIPPSYRNPVLTIDEIEAVGPEIRRTSQYLGLEIDLNALSAHHGFRFFEKFTENHPLKRWVWDLLR